MRNLGLLASYPSTAFCSKHEQELAPRPAVSEPAPAAMSILAPRPDSVFAGVCSRGGKFDLRIASNFASAACRVGPYHDRVQRHTDKISNHNDKLISYTDKGLRSTLAVCAGVEWSSHSEKLCNGSHSAKLCISSHSDKICLRTEV